MADKTWTHGLRSALIVALTLCMAGTVSCESEGGFVAEADAERIFVQGASIRFEESETLAAKIGEFAEFVPGKPITLTGAGIVVGLSGTGDSGEAFGAAMNLVSSIPDLRSPPGAVFEERALAMVLVETRLDPSLGASAGITGASVRPLGNATSLEDGTLLWTDLVHAESGEVLAVAVGPVLTSVADSRGDRVSTPTLGRLLRIEIRGTGKASLERALRVRIAWKELRDAIADAIRKEFPAIGVSTPDMASIRLQLPDDPTEYPEDWQEKLKELGFEASSGGLPRVLVDGKSKAIVSIGARVYVNRGTYLFGGNLKVVSFAPAGSPKQPSGREESSDASDGAMIEVVREDGRKQIMTLRWIRHVTRVLDRLAVPFADIRHWLETTSTGGGIGAEVIRADGLLE